MGLLRGVNDSRPLCGHAIWIHPNDAVHSYNTFVQYMSDETIATTSWWESYRTDVAAGQPHRIEVFFRSLAPSQGAHDKRRRIVSQLDEASSTSSLDSYDLHVVGDGMCLCEDCAETRLARHMHDTLATLREGGSDEIEPLAFSTRTVDSQMTGEHYTLLVPPEVSLAVYVDSSLRGVFPAAVEEVTVSVTDFLDAFTTLENAPATVQAEA